MEGGEEEGPKQKGVAFLLKSWRALEERPGQPGVVSTELGMLKGRSRDWYLEGLRKKGG